MARPRKYPDELRDRAVRLRDLLQRDFTASRPNEKWVADITYLRTWNGFCYLAFILDCYSRMIVGWQLATHLRTELVMDALEMATGLRQPAGGLIAHTDRGSQYTSLAYTDRVDELGAAPLGRLPRRCLRQRDGRGLGRDLQVRAGRRAPLSQLRARRA
jgi:transposase InsO family protein